MKKTATRFFLACTIVLMTLAGSLYGGVIIIDGTDSNDHGSAGSGGWLYMRSALNNIYSQLGAVPNKTVNVLDTTSGAQAQSAIAWAFANSNLPGAGWSINYIPLATVNTFLSGISTANTGILYVPTVGNTAGDAPDSLITSLTTYATNVNAFTGAGGGLFAEAESPTTAGINSYAWLSALLSGLTITDGGGGGFGNSTLTLTADGSTAFPGLTNADLSTGPWHNYFSGAVGGLKVLATGVNDAGVVVPVILGTSTTSITGTPEPSTLLLFGGSLLTLAMVGRRKKAASSKSS